MEKNLLIEISRAQEMMGIKIPLKESLTSCFFCKEFLNQIDELISLYEKNAIDLNMFSKSIDELDSKIDNLPLNLNQILTLKNAIKNSKSEISGDVSAFKNKMKSYIDNNEALSDVKIKINIIDDPKFAKYAYENSPDSKSLKEMTQKLIGKYPDVYKELGSIDNVINDFKSYWRPKLLKKGFNSKFVDNYLNEFDVWFKTNDNLNSIFLTKSTSGLITQRTVTNPNGGFIIEKLPDDIFEMYKAVIAKNGVDLTDAERKLLLDIEEWTKGKTVDFESYRTKSENTDTPTDEVNKKEVTNKDNPIPKEIKEEPEIYKLFEKSSSEVDISFLNVLYKLASSSLMSNKIIQNSVEALKKGKKLTDLEINEIKNILTKSENFKPEEIVSIENKLKNPTAGNTPLNAFYWKYVEPLFQTFIDLDLVNYIKIITGTKVPNAIDDIINFQEVVEKSLRDFDENMSIRELRKKFGKIKTTPQGQNIGTYDLIYKQWKKWMKTQLTDTVAIENFDALVKKLDNQTEDLFSSSWGKMVGSKVEKETGKKLGDLPKWYQLEGWVGWISRLLGGNIKESIVKAILPKLFSKFITNSFRTPKEMEEYLIKRGYSRSSRVKSFMKNLFYSRVLYPAVLYLIVGFAQIIYSAVSGTKDIDYVELAKDIFFGSGGVETTIKLVNEDFRKALPEWYKWFLDNKILQNITPPVIKTLIAIGPLAYASANMPKTDERVQKNKEKLKEKSIEATFKKAENDYNNMSEGEKNTLKIERYHNQILKNVGVRSSLELTKEEGDFLKSKMSFEGVPSFPDIKNLNLEDVKNIKTTGETTIKGKSGNKYLVVATTPNSDRYNIRSKTDDPRIKEGSFAILTPQIKELIKNPGSMSFVSLKDFYINYNKY